MIDVKRRRLMKGGLGLGALALFVGTVGVPLRALAAAKSWPKKAFEIDSVDQAIDELYGQGAADSDEISLDVPTIAQNGAVVPVKVSTSLPNVTAISILVDKNPSSLAASFEIPEGAQPYVSNRIKMAETSDVIAVVKSDGKLFKTAKNVKVTVGGCGG